MTQFKLKQAVVEAIRWQNGMLVRRADAPRLPWISQGLNQIKPGQPGSIIRYGMDVHIYDKDGLLSIVTNGDWIIRDESGNLLSLPDELFRQFFEPIQLLDTSRYEPVAIDWAQWDKAHANEVPLN